MSPSNPTDADGQGVNSNSRSWFDRVFQVCNQGTEDVCFHIRDDTDWPRVDDDDPDSERRVDFYLEDDRERSIVLDLADDDEGDLVPIPLGECVCVGIATNTTGLSEDDSLLEDIDDTVVLDADVGFDCGGDA